MLVFMLPWNWPSTMTLSHDVTFAVRTTPFPTTSTRSECLAASSSSLFWVIVAGFLTAATAAGTGAATGGFGGDWFWSGVAASSAAFCTCTDETGVTSSAGLVFPEISPATLREGGATGG